MDISKKLKDLRESKELTVAELAGKLSKEESLIEGWENGSVVPSAGDLIDLSKTYGMTMDEMLYNDAEIPEYNESNASYGNGVQKKKKKRKKGFSKSEKLTLMIFPILCLIVFLFLGIGLGLWHPGWIVFIMVPIYYGLVILLKSVGENVDDAVEEYMEDNN